MTPGERKDALVGLLGRVRKNAGPRLPSRTGDEEEFVPKSVLAARAAAAEAEASQAAPPSRDAQLDAPARPRFAPDDLPLETDPPPTAVPGSSPGTLEDALREAEEAEIARAQAEEAAAAASAEADSAPPTPRGEVADEAPSIEMGDSAELELDLFDPFDEPTATGAPLDIEADALQSEPPPPPKAPPRLPAQPPPAPPASLTRAIAPRSAPTIESPAVSPPPPAAAAPPVSRLVPPAPPSSPASSARPITAPSPSSPGSPAKPELRPAAPAAPSPPAPATPQAVVTPPAAKPPPVAPPPATPPAPPTQPGVTAPVSRVESTAPPLSIDLPPSSMSWDEQTEERDEVAARALADEVSIADDDLTATVNMPPRKVDPLAQTAQNPIPAAFERAVLRAEGTLVPPLGADKVESPDAAASPPADDHEADEPVSSKQPRALDRDPSELDDADDLAAEDEPPQSGEIASQRQPATGQHAPDLDLDGATPPTDQADAVADEAMALLDAEAVPSAPPPTRPAMMGRRPVAVTSFLDVLDDALALAE